MSHTSRVTHLASHISRHTSHVKTEAHTPGLDFSEEKNFIQNYVKENSHQKKIQLLICVQITSPSEIRNMDCEIGQRPSH